MRRIARDMDERGRTFPQISEQYHRTVRPMHLEFVEPSKRFADLIIPEGGENLVNGGPEAGAAWSRSPSGPHWWES